MRIDVTDNNLGQSAVFSRSDVATLFPFAGKPLKELCREHDNLLIFPHSIDDTLDRVGESTLIDLVNTSDPDCVQLVTHNVMGFLGVGDIQMKIRSRFDDGRDDYFLHYMLQRVLSFNLFDLDYDNEQEDIFDFLIFMFPYYLRGALRQGIYREYQTFRHNDANVKGSIDAARHIAHNMPFLGNIAYTTREYTSDNSMTQLIRHTIEFIKSRRYGSGVLTIDSETIDNVQTIVTHTPTYDRHARSAVISANLRQKTHPYYTEYRALQSLCLQILRMEEVKYGESDDELYGILFDGAWLWEEYVNTLLRDYGFIHAENKLKKNPIYLFADRSGIRYPDFYKDDIVLDAKYKRLGNYDKVSQLDPNDIHQVITYMQNLRATQGGFIAPLEKKQTKIPTSHLKDGLSTLSIYGIEISRTSSNYPAFCTDMKAKEDAFLRDLELI